MIIIKIGGSKDINYKSIIEDLSQIKEPFLIIHGANYFRDKLLADLNLEKKILNSISGYSSVYTDESIIDSILMTYSGLINKKLVILCQQNGINAIGLTGVDGGLIKGEKNKGIKVIENNKKKLIHDLSGKPKTINVNLLKLLIDNGYTPILTIPILDGLNDAINSENDDIIRLFAKELNPRVVIQLISEKGLIQDMNEPDSIIDEINYDQLIKFENQVHGRIKRKIKSIINLLSETDTRVIISDGRIENPIFKALSGNGTIISKKSKFNFNVFLKDK